MFEKASTSCLTPIGRKSRLFDLVRKQGSAFRKAVLVGTLLMVVFTSEDGVAIMPALALSGFSTKAVPGVPR